MVGFSRPCLFGLFGALEKRDTPSEVPGLAVNPAMQAGLVGGDQGADPSTDHP